MPAVSQAQQSYLGMQYAKVKAGGKSDTGMTSSQLKEFAATSRKGLPKRAPRKLTGGKR